MIGWAANLPLAAAFVSLAYLATCWAVLLRFDPPRSAAGQQPVPVTVLVPLAGAEPDLDRRLRALCRQDYPGPLQIVCGTLDPDDPAIAVVASVAADCPLVEMQVDARLSGTNLKMANLANMLRRARHDTLVMVDSDIDVDPDYLSTVVAALQKSGVGAVTCLYRGCAATASGSAAIAALELDCHFLPNVLVALTFALARPCFGATIALSRATLERIGGFAAFRDCLWDDYAIGEAVRELGAEVSVVPVALRHVCVERTWRDFIAGQLRAARTIRGIAPAAYAGSLITHPFPIAVIALLCGGGWLAALCAALALVGRLGLGRSVECRFGGPPNSYWLLPVRELLSFAVHLGGLFGSSVTWRRRSFRVLSDGTLRERHEVPR
jgi:ceramide glucosyltransferase